MFQAKIIRSFLCIIEFIAVTTSLHLPSNIFGKENETLSPSQRILYPLHSLVNISNGIITIQFVNFSSNESERQGETFATTTTSSDEIVSVYELSDGEAPHFQDAHEEGSRQTSSKLGSMVSLAALLVVFFCCSVGVFGIAILCCIACADMLGPMQDPATSNNNDNNRSESEETSSLTFVPVHRHPWSPGFYISEQEAFNFNNDNDLPPPYEDLSPKALSSPSSPPPPPYTPSFQPMEKS